MVLTVYSVLVVCVCLRFNLIQAHCGGRGHHLSFSAGLHVLLHSDAPARRRGVETYSDDHFS